MRDAITQHFKPALVVAHDPMVLSLGDNLAFLYHCSRLLLLWGKHNTSANMLQHNSLQNNC
jgi:hypothetical protein